MKPIALISAALLCTGAFFGHASFAGSLDSAVAAALSGTQAPGMAAALIRDGKAAETGVSGLKRNDGSVKLGPQDVWHIGSDGKPMTATLIAKLVDQGKLSWTAPLKTLLPDLAEAMRPEYRELTLVDLLSHRGGFDHDTTDMAFFNTFYGDTRPLPLQRLAYLKKALSEAPVVPPQTQFSYSNTGFLLAAAIAERATGKTYEELMQTEIFAPLAITSAGFGVVPAGRNSGHTAGKPVTEKDGNPAMFAPAGNIYLSMQDWTAFCVDQLQGAKGTGKLLKPETYRKMQTPVAADAHNGISWGTVQTVAGFQGPALTHAGSDGTWYALVVLFPQTGNGALAVTNAGEDMGGDKATKAMLKVLLPMVAQPVPTP